MNPETSERCQLKTNLTSCCGKERQQLRTGQSALSQAHRRDRKEREQQCWRRARRTRRRGYRATGADSLERWTRQWEWQREVWKGCREQHSQADSDRWPTAQRCAGWRRAEWERKRGRRAKCVRRALLRRRERWRRWPRARALRRARGTSDVRHTSA